MKENNPERSKPTSKEEIKSRLKETEAELLLLENEVRTLETELPKVDSTGGLDIHDRIKDLDKRHVVLEQMQQSLLNQLKKLALKE